MPADLDIHNLRPLMPCFWLASALAAYGVLGFRSLINSRMLVPFATIEASAEEMKIVLSARPSFDTTVQKPGYV